MVVATNSSCVRAQADVLTAALSASVEQIIFFSFQQTCRNFAPDYGDAAALADLLPDRLCITQPCQILSFVVLSEGNFPDVLKVFDTFI